jgi:hypothetical protein
MQTSRSEQQVLPQHVSPALQQSVPQQVSAFLQQTFFGQHCSFFVSQQRVPHFSSPFDLHAQPPSLHV